MANFNYVQLVFDRELLSADEDVAVMGMHIREHIQDSPDFLPVTDQGRADFVTKLTTWWTSMRPLITTKISFHEARFYDVPSTPGADMGDPVLVHPFGLLGTSSSAPLPPQLAVSVTYKTDTRKWWGRNYVPGITQAALDFDGRILVAECDAIVTAFKELTRRDGTGTNLVVFSRTHWSHKDPTQIQVDDVPDVIRRRRFSTTHYRAILGAG